MAGIQHYTRIFFGIQPDEATIDQIDHTLTDLKSRFPQIKWSRAHNYHFTLRFLADSNSVEVEELVSVLRERLPHQIDPFRLTFSSVDSFGRSYPRVWFWTVDEHPSLAALAGFCDDVADMSNKSWFERQHDFNPHMTFCRVQQVQTREQKALLNYRNTFRTLEPISFDVRSFTLFQSEGDGQDRRYTPLYTFGLEA